MSQTYRHGAAHWSLFGDEGRWFALVVAAGVLVGVSLPLLAQEHLEIYFALLAILIVLVFWTMPRPLRVSDQSTWVLFVALLTALCVYPIYVSLRFPGLPWISPTRLILVGFALLWFYVFFCNREWGSSIARYARENPWFFVCLIAFNLAQLLSVVTSRDPALSASKAILYQFYWTLPFLAVLTMVTSPARFRLIAVLFLAFAGYQTAIGFLEARLERILWLDWLPPGFAADSEFLQRVVQGTFRADGYRVQGSFTTSLNYAEFLVMMLPFALHYALEGRNTLLRVVGFAVSVAILPAQYLSGSRLGMVGTIVVFLGLGTIYMFRAWRENRRSLLGPLLVLMLPFLFAAFVGAFVSSPRLQSMTIGGGEHAASNDARWVQLDMGLPRVVERPLFGHGVGRSTEVVGYANLAGIPTIDNYLLTLVVEIGIVGFVAFLGMMGLTIWKGIQLYIGAPSPEARFGGAIALSLISFLTVKFVLSTVENHTPVFMMFGMVLVLARGWAVDVAREPARASTARVASTSFEPNGPRRPALVRRPKASHVVRGPSVKTGA